MLERTNHRASRELLRGRVWRSRSESGQHWRKAGGCVEIRRGGKGEEEGERKAEGRRVQICFN